uniref:Uncharacterized protein n=1 Tax=Solanum lycopersicum TaxID=4081 RepID=A0A3Q7I369_SOLLC
MVATCARKAPGTRRSPPCVGAVWLPIHKAWGDGGAARTYGGLDTPQFSMPWYGASARA